MCKEEIRFFSGEKKMVGNGQKSKNPILKNYSPIQYELMQALTQKKALFWE